MCVLQGAPGGSVAQRPRGNAKAAKAVPALLDPCKQPHRTQRPSGGLTVGIGVDPSPCQRHVNATSIRKGMNSMAGKARTRPSFKKNTRRYKTVIAPAKVLEGQRNLTKKRRYANRHG
ncbi:hypothetical protein JKG68_08715 [Microvirga aerilata]|uniref:Uncharacterized protein n=1 Tax=Microvirga aerilata TaxID=670292 RepID=A0A936Z6C2_9HYPH|nr:hypothetical protein [Microvirga aerilata]MBL0404043.1 hypothetical protein [Microvirga aerilata]